MMGAETGKFRINFDHLEVFEVHLKIKHTGVSAFRLHSNGLLKETLEEFSETLPTNSIALSRFRKLEAKK